MRSPLESVARALTGRLAAGASNAAPPVPLVGRNGGVGIGALSSGTTGSGQALDQMSSVGTLFAIVNRLSVDTASVDWHMHRRASRAPGTQVKTCDMCDAPGCSLVVAHPALSLLSVPVVGHLTRFGLIEASQQHLDLTGEAWWVIGYAGDRPVEIWPVRPDRMAPVPDRETFISGYTYRSPDGQQVSLSTNEVILTKMPNPKDPYRGLGPVQALLMDLDSARYSAEWNRNFFLNDATPGGVIQLPGDDPLDDDTFNILRERWAEQHRGVGNAHRVALLEMGTWVNTAFSQRDMQFAELRNLGREVIREAFAVHGHMLGLSQDVNLANAKTAEESNGQHQVLPRLTRWRETLNFRLLPLFGPGLDGRAGYEFVFDNPIPRDKAAEVAERQACAGIFATLVGAGVDPEDAANVAGLPPMRMGAVTSMPSPSDPLPESPPSPDLEGDGMDEGMDEGMDDSIEDVRRSLLDIENAMRWQAHEVLDDSTCDACREVDGKLYRNRADAYADYPGGQGYKGCAGRDNCRGEVRKRKGGG